MKRACIFCASSPAIPDIYKEEATRLSEILVSKGWGIVYGGGSTGLMGAVADAALAKGGEVTGVIPTFMVEVEWQHPAVADMRQTATMSDRKTMMMDISDAIIVLAGSTGTMDEFFEAMSDKKLGLHNKPIVLLNTKGFFDHTVKQLELMVEEKFMTQRHLDVLSVANTPEEAVQLIETEQRPAITLTDAAVK